MNHHFLEFQASEKIEKYRSEGTSSQSLSRSMAGGKPIFETLRQHITRVIKSRRWVSQLTEAVVDEIMQSRQSIIDGENTVSTRNI
jgi:hypothetical protein